MKTFIDSYQVGDPTSSRLACNQRDPVPKMPRQEAKKAEKEDWNEIMNYFKENPKALLDAIPTPRGEEEKALKEFKAGQMRFNETSTSGFGNTGFKGKFNSSYGLFGDTPSKSRLQSPSTQLMQSRKINGSQLKTYDGLALSKTNSTKSLSSPYRSNILSKTLYQRERELRRPQLPEHTE